jgi:hypothetical protein
MIYTTTRTTGTNTVTCAFTDRQKLPTDFRLDRLAGCGRVVVMRLVDASIDDVKGDSP